ncbi:MAG: hypothetical protein ACNA8G_02875 [Gammaproteobacteria bacterium]
MFRITADTTVDELAAVISQALKAAGIIAMLSGGAGKKYGSRGGAERQRRGDILYSCRAGVVG